MRHILITIAALFLIGCSGGNTTPTQEAQPVITEPIVDNTKHIIYDNDHFDPDWVIGLDTVLTLHNIGTITVDAIVLTGTDVYGKSGLKYDAITEYYGLDIPIGINHRTPMRVTPDDSSKIYPKLDGRYAGGYEDVTHFPSDHLLDSQRQESVALLCEVLTKAPDKSITYIVGGHLQNFSDLLKEKEYCDGYTLIHSKVKELVINTGGIGGKPETNLSEGLSKPTATSSASIYTFANTYIPILVTAEFMDTYTRPGDVYLNHKVDSPQAFIIAVPRYGTYGDHGISDNAAIMVGVYGTNLHGNDYVTKQRVCFNTTSYGALKLGGGCDKEHYYMKPMNTDLVGNYTIELLNL